MKDVHLCHSDVRGHAEKISKMKISIFWNDTFSSGFDISMKHAINDSWWRRKTLLSTMLLHGIFDHVLIFDKPSGNVAAEIEQIVPI
jgi:hypothetical protein